jgi:hypothetical protein
MKWSGVLGAGTSLGRWVQGERSLPRVVDRRYGLLALGWVQYPDRAMGRGDGTGARSGPPSQDGFVLQNTSCAFRNRAVHAFHSVSFPQRIRLIHGSSDPGCIGCGAPILPSRGLKTEPPPASGDGATVCMGMVGSVGASHPILCRRGAQSTIGKAQSLLSPWLYGPGQDRVVVDAKPACNRPASDGIHSRAFAPLPGAADGADEIADPVANEPVRQSIDLPRKSQSLIR